MSLDLPRSLLHTPFAFCVCDETAGRQGVVMGLPDGGEACVFFERPSTFADPGSRSGCAAVQAARFPQSAHSES